MTQRLRVLIAEDHPAVRAALAAALGTAEDLEVVGFAQDGPSAIEQARRLAPDVVLTDVRMPGATGIDITPRLRAGGARVLVISAFDLDAAVLGAIAAGAEGFVTKSEDPSRIVAAVRAVGAGDAVLSASAQRAVVRALQGRSAEPAEPARETTPSAVPLTERETDVLALLADGLSNREIADTLFVEITTVKTHVTNVLAKLGVTSRVQAALWWHRHRGD